MAENRASIALNLKAYHMRSDISEGSHGELLQTQIEEKSDSDVPNTF